MADIRRRIGQDRCVRWRPHYRSRLELFGGGIALGAALGYSLEQTPAGVVATLIVAFALTADAIRRGGAPGLWLVGLGFCATVSKLSVTETEAALGIARVPLIAVGSLLAVAAGIAVDPEFRSGIGRARL